jgi:hypothetical protein
MGSFASTCCISGLPINNGDAVRWFLLNQSPYNSPVTCYIYNLWNPRTWPIKAAYDDYGSIRDWETGPLLDVILEGFQEDLVGNEQATRGMPFPDLLQAVWTGSLTVSRDYQPILKGLTAVPSAIDKSGFVEDYTPGDSQPLMVKQAMIREDVWQALLALKVPHMFKYTATHKVEDYRACVRDLIAEFGRRKAELDANPAASNFERRGLYADLEREGFEVPGAFLLTRGFVPFSVGLQTHAKKLFDNGFGFSSEFSDLAAEFAFIWNLLEDVRHVWRPTYTAGPQVGEYKAHTEFYRAMTRVSVAAGKAQQRKRSLRG